MNRFSNSNDITRQYIDSILMEERMIDVPLPCLETELFGEKFASPILTPALSHLPHYQDRPDNGLVEYSKAARELNYLNFVGMMENEGWDEIAAAGAKTFRIIKPYADRDKVLSQLEYAASHGAFGAGMDIDHIFSNGGYDVVRGESMTSQSVSDLAEYVKATSLPFVVKGVLSVQDAVKSAEAGAKGIIVSHHHGRLSYAVPPMMVLPSIVRALNGSGVEILVDCGIENGSDVYKALALGANAAAVGRSLMPPTQEGGVEGAQQYLKKTADELMFCMASTGFSKVSDIDASALWINGKKVLENE